MHINSGPADGGWPAGLRKLSIGPRSDHGDNLPPDFMSMFGAGAPQEVPAHE